MRGIVQKNLGIDSEYQLEEKLIIKTITIDSISKNVVIYWERVVVTPTDIVVCVKEEGSYVRTDTTEKAKYTILENSSVGLGIKQLLEFDLNYYPNF